MKTNLSLLAAFCGLALVAVGCIKTMSDEHQAGVPLIKDRIQSRYERPSDQVYQAAKDVIQFNGTIIKETIIPVTNGVNRVSAKVVEGKVDQRAVWVRVEQQDAKTSSVVVQTRSTAGASDIDLAAELDKQIALKLQR